MSEVDFGTVGDSLIVTAIIVFVVFITVAAIVYAFLKRQGLKNTGVPKLTDEAKEHQGSTKQSAADAVDAAADEAEAAADVVDTAVGKAKSAEKTTDSIDKEE